MRGGVYEAEYRVRAFVRYVRTGRGGVYFKPRGVRRSGVFEGGFAHAFERHSQVRDGEIRHRVRERKRTARGDSGENSQREGDD